MQSFLRSNTLIEILSVDATILFLYINLCSAQPTVLVIPPSPSSYSESNFPCLYIITDQEGILALGTKEKTALIYHIVIVNEKKSVKNKDMLWSC